MCRDKSRTRLASRCPPQPGVVVRNAGCVRSFGWTALAGRRSEAEERPETGQHGHVRGQRLH